MACRQSALSQPAEFHHLYGIILLSESKKIKKGNCINFCEFEFMIGGYEPCNINRSRSYTVQLSLCLYLVCKMSVIKFSAVMVNKEQV